MVVLGLSKDLTAFERKVYEFLKEHGEVLISDMTHRLRGALPNLKNKGLVEVYKKRVVPWASKKRKFVRIIEKS
jgi:hypothetical protein